MAGSYKHCTVKPHITRLSPARSLLYAVKNNLVVVNRWGGDWPNAEQFKCTRINAGAYSLSRHGSWQNQLSKYCVNV